MNTSLMCLKESKSTQNAILHLSIQIVFLNDLLCNEKVLMVN